jgi:hypothetical protein
LFESRRHGGFCQHGVVAFLGFSRRDVADRLQQPAIVEPVHPFERCELDGFHGPPRSPPMDNLGLVEAILETCDRHAHRRRRQARPGRKRDLRGGQGHLSPARAAASAREAILPPDFMKLGEPGQRGLDRPFPKP